MRKKYLQRKVWGSLLALTLSIGLLSGCGSSGTENTGGESASGEKVFYYGDTTFNTENGEADVNPHNGYSGWACIRYGIGEISLQKTCLLLLPPLSLYRR